MCISLLGRLNLTIPGWKTQSKFYLYQNVPFLPRLRIFAIQLNTPFFLFSQFPPGQNPRFEKLDPCLKHHFSSHGWKHHRKGNITLSHGQRNTDVGHPDLWRVGFILWLQSLTFNKNHKNISPTKYGIYHIYSNFEYIYMYVILIIGICTRRMHMLFIMWLHK